jgi:hypothetical protein
MNSEKVALSFMIHVCVFIYKVGVRFEHRLWRRHERLKSLVLNGLYGPF